MRLLLFSDLHCDLAAAGDIVSKAASVDVVVGAGDFGSVRRGIGTCVDALKAIQKPTVLVPGNNESYDELVDACMDWPAATVLHGSSVEIHGLHFFGLGGGVPVTPFGDWSFDLTEEEAARMLSSCPEECVLVSHSPPKGTVDKSSRGQSLGSTAVRDAITEKRPFLVVCGHIHESASQSGKIGRTPVVNAGPTGIEWQLDRRMD